MELDSGNELDGLDPIAIEAELFEIGEFDLREMIESQLPLVAWIIKIVPNTIRWLFHSSIRSRYSFSLG